MFVALILACLVAACAADPPEPVGRPTAVVPDISDDLRGLGSGVLNVDVDANAVKDLDPLSIAIGIGVAPPACADFVMAFTWQVREPDPVGSARVGFMGERMGGRFEVAPPAPSGQATIGCALLQAVNPTNVPLVVQLRFTVATSRR